MNRAFVIVDGRIPPGCMEVGGVVIFRQTDDAEIGFAATARPVRVSSTEEADALEAKLKDDGFECRRAVGVL